MKIFLTFLGRAFALLPRRFVQAFCRGIGWLIASFPSPRRRALFANVYRCFPHLSKAEIRSIALDSCVRTVEMALFVLASPYIPERELKSRIIISDFVKEELKRRQNENRPLLLLVPHFCMMESITLLPMLSETPLPPAGVFYRPFDNRGMEEWIRNTRQKYGINLLSRRDGLMVSLDYLRNNKCIAVLFDQNSRASGVLTMFFDRLCATSEIAGILAERTKTDTAIFYARRTGFWQAEIMGEYMETREQRELIFKSNDWLEEKLKSDPELCRDWLWLHKRWKISDYPTTMLKVSHRNIVLDEYAKFKNIPSIPRKTSFLVRAPHTLEEILEFIPAFRALRASRYDGHFTIMADPRHADFLRALGLAENVIKTPEDKKRLKELRDSYFYAEILFADTPEDDRHARAICPEFSFAIRQNRRRRGFRFVWQAGDDDAKLPKHALYEKFLRNFGMDKPLDFTQAKLDAERNEDLLAICVGQSESLKTAEWKSLLREISKFMPYSKFAIFHTNASAPMAAELANIFADRVESVTNASDTLGIAASKMAQCKAATGTDTLLLKLANFISVPCVKFDNAKFLYGGRCVSVGLRTKTAAELSAFAGEVCTELSLADLPE